MGKATWLASGGGLLRNATLIDDDDSNCRWHEIKNIGPFTHLGAGTYLHGRPEQDVYKLLVDCFRMRQQDNDVLEGHTDPDSVYSGASTSMVPFRKFIDLTVSCSGLLPSWWNDAKRAECEAFGESGNWSDLKKKATKQSIIDHYDGDSKMPMQLRMFGEVAYKRGPGGQDGTAMRNMLMEMKKKKKGGKISPIIRVDKMEFQLGTSDGEVVVPTFVPTNAWIMAHDPCGSGYRVVA